MFLLIPAFEPGPRLAALVTAALDGDPDLQVLVVDDGSGPRFAEQFRAAECAGAILLTHTENRGKGAALKTGFAWIEREAPGDDVLTADADGQHTAGDIARLGEGLRADAAAGRSALILGVRGFSGEVPLRSRVGNHIARGLFRLAAGWTVSDTQTGLRGIPHDLLPWLQTVPGDRFEYEIEMLLRLRASGGDAREMPIETVYLEQNASSHFRPIIDSLRVTLPLLLFTASSLLAFGVDTLALLVFTALSGALVPSIIAARVLSASVNFAVNRSVVFRDAGPPGGTRGRRGGRRAAVRQAVAYAGLAVLLLASNIVWMDALTRAGLPLLLAKIGTEVVLFLTSYQVQRRLVFARTDVRGPIITRMEELSASQDPHSRRKGAAARMDADTQRDTLTHPLERTS